MPADPVSAGRKGGQSRSPKKLAAAKRNGFQKVKKENSESEQAPAEQAQSTGAPPLLLAMRKDADAHAA